MLAVRTVLAPGAASRPPIVLVHGAANSARVWTRWQAALAARGYSSHALDLRGHGESAPADLGRTTMGDYAADVTALARTLSPAPVLVGWSMGGLVALLAAAPARAVAWVGLAPSPPARARDATVALRDGVFGPEEYGILGRDADVQPTMPDLDREARQLALSALGPESRRARDERKAGVVVAPLPCPALLVAGDADESFPPAVYADAPLVAERLTVPGASHWGLVLGSRALATLVPAVTAWIGRAVG